MIIHRRHFVQLSLLAITAPSRAAGPAPLDLFAAIQAGERATGSRIGLTVHDTATGRRFSHRGAELFPMASTFKVLLVAAVLTRVDAGKECLDRTLSVPAAGILPNSPFSKARAGRTATVMELCEATITQSDNSAANLLLPSVGGPAGLTAWLRGIGDSVSRLDRDEPMMSEAMRGDPRDVSSPQAYATSLERILLGPILATQGRERLTRWLIANTTGGKRLRAGLPKGWTVGDKTGTGGNGTVNDVAIVWPKRAARGPVIITSFITEATVPDDRLYAVHAGLARAISASL